VLFEDHGVARRRRELAALSRGRYALFFLSQNKTSEAKDVAGGGGGIHDVRGVDSSLVSSGYATSSVQ